MPEMDTEIEGRLDERERLRPLLERCEEELASLEGQLIQKLDGPLRPALVSGLLADLRRELGKK